MSNELSVFKNQLALSFNSGQFVKLSLGNYQGSDSQLKGIIAKPILVKAKPLISFTYRNKTNDIIKNFSHSEALEIVAEQLAGGFKIATLFTTSHEVIFEYNKKGVACIRQKSIELNKPNLMHDKQKGRLVGGNFLFHLGIADKAGVVFDKGQDKYKQINHYVELLSPLLSSWNRKTSLKVTDMGSGKGYLTFALYH